jgi:hypothetical protein
MRQKLQAPDPTTSERRPILPSSSLHRPIWSGVIFLSALVRVFCVSLSLYEKLKVSKFRFVCSAILPIWLRLFFYFAIYTYIYIYIYGFSMCCDTHKFQCSF